MSETPEQVSQNPFEDLGLQVGIEFDDCSLAAAETCQLGREVFQFSDNRLSTLYVIDGDVDPSQGQTAQFIDLRTTLNSVDGPSKLILTQLTREEIVKQRYGLLRRSVTLAKRDRIGDVMLAARIGEDCILPLASFAEREDSEHCNYVQLGSEITDETVVMTGLDATTSRHGIVEAIRVVLEKAEKIYNHKYRTSSDQDTNIPRDARDNLQGLLDQQLGEYHDKTAEAREAQLTRRCAERVANDSKDNSLDSDRVVVKSRRKSKRNEVHISIGLEEDKTSIARSQRLNVLTEDNSTYSQDTHVASLLSDARLGDGRIVSLVLGKEVGDTTDEVQLLAIARGDIALPIASMFSENGIITFQNEHWDNQGTEREQLIDTLLSCVRGEALRVDWQTPESYSLREQGKLLGIGGPTAKEPDAWGNNGFNYYDRLAATYCYEIGLLKKDEGAMNDRYQKCGITREGAESTYYELERFFRDPEIMEIPWPLSESPPFKLALSRLPELRKAQQDLLNLFDVESQLADKLGECSPEEERLIRQLNVMSRQARQFSAVIENLDTGKTRADVALRANIIKHNTSYVVSILARPQAMDNEEFKPYLQYSFDTTGTLFSCDGITDDLGDRRARRLFDVLRQLQPVMN